MCASLGISCARRVPRLFIAETGACAHVGRPGHGRALALEMYKITNVVAAEIEKQDIGEVQGAHGRRSSARSPSGSSVRGRSKKRKSNMLEALVDKLEGRRQRRKDKKVVGSCSSSSSSAGSFCVATRLLDRKMDSFPTWSPPENSILKKLHRQSKRHGGTYVASKPFEQWVPAHVGKTLPADERRTLLRQRDKECKKNATKVFESIQCFWMAHAVVSRDIPPQAVQAHVAVLSRLHSEYDLEFVVEYERYLHVEILESLSDRTPLDFKVVLANVRETTVQRITSQRIRSIEERMKASEQSKRQSGGQAPAVTSRGRVDTMPSIAGKKEATDRKTPLCLSHDIARSKYCANAENGKCSFVHLDTRKPEEAKRFAAASRAVEQRGNKRRGVGGTRR